MRKLLLVIFCLFLYLFAAGQDYGRYALQLNYKSVQNTGNDMKYIDYDLYLDFVNEESSKLIRWRTKDVDEGDYADIPSYLKPFVYYFDVKKDNIPPILYFRTYREWGGGKKHISHFSRLSLNFAGVSIQRTITKSDNGEDIYPECSTVLDLFFGPENINIWYFGADGKEQPISGAPIPDNHEITLKATKGFHQNIYDWEYSLDSANTWSDFPASTKYGDSKSEITFKGSDIPGFDVANKNFHIRINSLTAQYPITPYIFILKPCRSGPTINSISYDKARCHKPDSANVRLHLSRDITEDEKFYVKVDDRINQWQVQTILIDKKTIQVSGVSSGHHVFSIWGGANGEPYFTGSPEHYAEQTIDPRQAINFSIPTSTDATCYGGTDGTITVSATREPDATFKAYLYQGSLDNIIQEVSFANAESKIFSGLSAGDYSIKVTDENGCKPAIQNAKVGEPLAPVSVDGDIAFQEPKGVNTKDGAISFSIKGGRGSYTVKIIDQTLSVPKGSSINIENNNCVISGLGRGTYNITITDGSYRPEFGNNCGCLYEFQFTVVAPALIEPATMINKHVLCYSDNNGSATITAKGGRPYDPTIGTYDFAWYKKTETTPFLEEFKKSASTYDRLTAGEYIVIVKDKNNIDVNIEFIVKEPDPVLVNFESDNISCYGGNDGRVSVVATGGVGKYKTQLVGGDNYSKTLEFETQTSAEFSGLSTGNYYLYLTDINGCPIRNVDDVSKTVEYYEIIITEPKAPVKAELVNIQLPTSYNSADGEAIVRVLGGTTQAGKYKVMAKAVGAGVSLNPVQSVEDGVYMVYTFNGLKRGKYIIEAGDDYFTELTTLPCGCGDRIEVDMVSPEQMSVELKELKSVTCYGSSTAEAMVSAKGGVPFSGAQMPYQYKWYRVSGGIRETIAMDNDSTARNLSAGNYQVDVFDMKNVTISSDVLTISEPDSLSISFEITNIDCSGANTGSIKAVVKGGIAPYSYQWNVSGVDERVQNLAMGRYTLIVADANGCSKVAQAEVKSAVQIIVDSTVVQPNCLSPSGSIGLQLSGGSAPYSVLWLDNNSNALKRENLAAGTYKAIITDNKGCQAPYEFKLREPYSFTVTLPDDFVMCRNQSRTIKAECKEPGVTYKWYYGEQELQDDANFITVNKSGIYRVVTTNSIGCQAQDEILVTVSSESLNLDMIAPTIVAAGSEIHAVNLSTVAAEYLVWTLPEQAIILKRDNSEAVFVINKEGNYEVALEGFKAGCSTIVTRTVEVVSSNDSKLPADSKALIKQFLVTPNPTTGYFKVMVELNKEDDFTMKLYSPSGVLVDEKQGVKVQNKSFEYEINGSIQGTYLLHLITQYDKAVLQVVVKNQ